MKYSKRMNQVSPCPICGCTKMSLVFRYDSPPAGETRFDFPGWSYEREVWQCQTCGYFVNRLAVDLDTLYEGEYDDTTYGVEGLLPAFRRIMALPPEQSDNYHRVKRIVSYMSPLPEKRGGQQPTSVLDVGSGLCVFLARLKEAGWECTALDPDQRAVEHARRQVGIKAICGDFMTVLDLASHDLITFNKVLEHVSDPLGMLKKSRNHLREGGMVYVEVPDGEMAMVEGPGRQEFFIEHRYVFSMTSLSLLATRAGFIAQIIERVRDPSGKYTLYAFLTDAHANQQ